MMYWYEMDNKFGFSDGTALPDGIELYRDVYCKGVNKLAEAIGSEYRVIPFDRPGIHNPCMWLEVPREWFVEVYLPKQTLGEQWIGETKIADIPDVSAVDSEMTRAIDEAMEYDLDSFVWVNPTISPNFSAFLSSAYEAPVS